MPRRLLRKNNTGHLHFITTSCYRRAAFLGKARRRDLFLEIFEQVRRRYQFIVVGYVVMPEAGGPAFGLVGVTYVWGAPSFAPFAKGGNHERLRRCFDHVSVAHLSITPEVTILRLRSDFFSRSLRAVGTTDLFSG